VKAFTATVSSPVRVELDPAGLVHEVREARLAVMAHRDHPAGQADGPEALELLVAGVTEPLGEPAGPLSHRIAPAERVDTAPAHGLELFAALSDQIVLV
jgi:hypothetical protein